MSSAWFFFSSRRRHTRLQGDWSSDVCSSDLEVFASLFQIAIQYLEGCVPHQLRERQNIDAGPPTFDGESSSKVMRRWLRNAEIGRASCRERVVMSDVSETCQKKNKYKRTSAQ